MQSFEKTTLNQKWEIPGTVREKRTLCFNSYNNVELKNKLWWVGPRETKKMECFLPFTFS